MYIETKKCEGCKNCIDYCPVEAITYHPRRGLEKAYSSINRDECVECAVCHRSNICPANAFVQEPLEWPRVIRSAFSDPFTPHSHTNIPGRGTEEMKTNDVTDRIKKNTIGFALEFGRPGIGLRLKEVEPIIKLLFQAGLELEPNNPLTQLIDDKKQGKLNKEIINEKVLSTIIEFKAPIEKSKEIFQTIKDFSENTKTVFCLSIVGRVSEDGSIPVLKAMKAEKIDVAINGKVNVGLGKKVIK